MASTKRSPFPGMDPWLEHPGSWSDVHAGLITYLRDGLSAALPGRYYARMGERVVLETPPGGYFYPDVEVIEPASSRPGSGGGAAAAVAEAPPDAPVVVQVAVERRVPFLEIHDAKTGGRIVTVIEVLSPSNKAPGTLDRERYVQKQSELFNSDVSLVEIDLLRAPGRVLPFPEESLDRHRPFHYVVCTNRPRARMSFELHLVPLWKRLPRIAIPLVPPDADVVVDLQALVEQVYERGSYAREIDYAKPPTPPLDPDAEAWARTVLAAAAAGR